MKPLGFNPKSLLEDFRKQHSEVPREMQEAPPISKQLIAYLRSKFEVEDIMANDPVASQKLLIQLGIDKVFKMLEDINAKQEAGIKQINREDDPNRLITKR